MLLLKRLTSIALILFSTISFSYPLGHPFPGFKIAGNLYYVGTDDLASYLVATPKGLILINTDMEANVPMIKANVEKLGFKFSDIKYILISHAHMDHAGGSKLIKELTHAQYLVMEQDKAVVESGGKKDFNYANDTSYYFPETKVDKVLHDNDKVQLGDTVLTAHLTAGHTPGCTTWTMKVKDKAKVYNVVILGSLSVNPGYQLVGNKNYPNIAKDFEHSFRVLKALPCDIFLGAHAGYFDLQGKYNKLADSEENPFVDPVGYKRYLAQKEKDFKVYNPED